MEASGRLLAVSSAATMNTSASTPMCSFRQSRRFFDALCLCAFHLPRPRILSPVESTIRSIGPSWARGQGRHHNDLVPAQEGGVVRGLEVAAHQAEQRVQKRKCCNFENGDGERWGIEGSCSHLEQPVDELNLSPTTVALTVLACKIAPICLIPCVRHRGLLLPPRVWCPRKRVKSSRGVCSRLKSPLHDKLVLLPHPLVSCPHQLV